MLGEVFHIDKETVRINILEDLKKKKLYARFVPHALTNEQKEERMEVSRDLLQTCKTDPNFLRRIVTGDESWCFAYDPKTKRQSAVWVGPESSRAKKIRFQEFRVKTMLIVFFDACGLIHKEFVPEGQTDNAGFYKEVLDRLLKRIARVRPEIWKLEDYSFCCTTMHLLIMRLLFSSSWRKKR
ncbi:hypothetical protein PGB90_004747 [Kerria lacca]